MLQKKQLIILKKISIETVLGIGTGSTVNYFIKELDAYKNLFRGAVSSSEASSQLLREKNIEVFSLNDVNQMIFTLMEQTRCHQITF